MKKPVVNKSEVHSLLNIIDYLPESVVTKTIIHKTTGSICISAVDSNEYIAEKTLPFDTFIHIIEGSAIVIIDEQVNILKTGDLIIIPAHTEHIVKAKLRFKMLSTIIKSGYEGSSIESINL